LSAHLIVAPGEHDVVETTMGLVDTTFCRIYAVMRVRVRFERLRVYDLVRKAATDDKRILYYETGSASAYQAWTIEMCTYTDDVPLAFGIKHEK
jgi:hypothetical protein